MASILFRRVLLSRSRLTIPLLSNPDRIVPGRIVLSRADRFPLLSRPDEIGPDSAKYSECMPRILLTSDLNSSGRRIVDMAEFSRHPELSPFSYLQSQGFARYVIQRGKYSLVMQCASAWILAMLDNNPCFEIKRPFYPNNLVPHYLRDPYEKEVRCFHRDNEKEIGDLISKLKDDGGGDDLPELHYFWPNLKGNSCTSDIYYWLYVLAKHNNILNLTPSDYFKFGMHIYYDFMERFQYPQGGVEHPDGLGPLFTPQQIAQAIPINGYVVVKQLTTGHFILYSVGVRYEHDLTPVTGFVVFNVEFKCGKKRNFMPDHVPGEIEICWPGPLLFS